MSRVAIERIVGRALLDGACLEAFRRCPEDALADSGLDGHDRARVADAFRTDVAKRQARFA